jgi:hypothetical protein
MKVGFFYTAAQLDEHRLALKAMQNGVSKQDETFFGYDSQYRPCDLAVTWSIYKTKLPHTKTREIIHNEQKSKNKKVIVIEKGYINRSKYYSVGYDSQNGWADFKNKDMPPDRFHNLGVKLKEYRKGGEHILLCGQVPWDTSVQHLDYEEWCRSIVGKIKKHTNRPIIFRPHPLAAGAFTQIAGAKTSNKKALEEDLEDCWAAVSYNSNALVIAAIKGIPIFACSDGSMALEISEDFVDLDNPKLYNREQWAYNIAYSQWTLDEMRSGRTWEHLK